MATTPQTTSYQRYRIGEGRQLFPVPSSRANPELLTFDQAICHQSHDREQSQQNWCRPGNRQVTPLSLCFKTQMSARFFEGDFHPPTPHKPAQDLQRRVVDISRKKCLRIIFALRIAHHHPANQYWLEPGFIPDTGLSVDLNLPLLAAIPMLDFDFHPRRVGIIKTLLRGGAARPFHSRSSILSGQTGRSRVPQLCIHAQSRNQTNVRRLTNRMQQFEYRKTAVTDKDQGSIRQPACDQSNDLPGPLGQLLMSSSAFSMIAFRWAAAPSGKAVPRYIPPTRC